MTLPSRNPVAAVGPQGRVVVPDEMIPAHRGAVSVWTQVTRTGDWILPRTFRGITLMGGMKLDLLNAWIGEGESNIELRSLWGGVEIIIPNDVHVECDVDALAAGVEIIYKSPSIAQPGAPTIRITGTVLMAGVEVIIKER